MSLGQVVDAYSSQAERYIGFVDDTWRNDDAEAAFVSRNLTGLPGNVLDLGCGPGHWTGFLRSCGVDAIGVDVVPEFIEHARVAYPDSEFRVGSMTEISADASCAGILSWYSTIHFSPTALDGVLAGFRRALRPGGLLVVGFFDSDDDVSVFDHAVAPAYRWPCDVFAEKLTCAGFREVERLRRTSPDQPDRMHAALAAVASR